MILERTQDHARQHLRETRRKASRKELPIILKSDCAGFRRDHARPSLEQDARSDEVTISVKHSSVGGGINEIPMSLLAEAAGAIIIGFNVTTHRPSAVRKAAEMNRRRSSGFYDVIYDITDDVHQGRPQACSTRIQKHRDPRPRRGPRGRSRFHEGGHRWPVATSPRALVERQCPLIRVTRNEHRHREAISKLAQLKRFKDDAREVKSGMECGMKIDGYDDIKAGDVLECYKTIEVARSL